MTKTTGKRTSRSSAFGVSTSADVAAFKAASARLAAKATASPAVAKKLIERIERSSSEASKSKK